MRDSVLDRSLARCDLGRQDWVVEARHRPKKLSKSDALQIAQTECETRGLPWVEPVRVLRESWNRYRVWTNADMRGGNVIVDVDRRDGRIVNVAVPPR